MKRLALSTILLAAGALLGSGCVYKMSIQQGNYLVAESVSQLKEGMTRSQVRFLLGTPMVPDAFNDDRWDYYYFFESRQYRKPLKRRLTVFFADEKVARYENLGVPTQSDLEQVERDLRQARAETNSKREKPGLWKRMFGRDKPAEQTATDSKASDSKAPAAQAPDPVPAPAPAVPEPAGMPSGQQ
jgi:outer membrane protein assembly factor BamE